MICTREKYIKYVKENAWDIHEKIIDLCCFYNAPISIYDFLQIEYTPFYILSDLFKLRIHNELPNERYNIILQYLIEPYLNTRTFAYKTPNFYKITIFNTTRYCQEAIMNNYSDLGDNAIILQNYALTTIYPNIYKIFYKNQYNVSSFFKELLHMFNNTLLYKQYDRHLKYLININFKK